MSFQIKPKALFPMVILVSLSNFNFSFNLTFSMIYMLCDFFYSLQVSVLSGK